MKRFATLVILFSFLACSRDPNVVKKKYLDSGNKYFNREKYKEASIMYRRALAKDQRYDQAYYRLALAELRMGRIASAVGPLRRAIELLPQGADRMDANLKLADIYLVASTNSQQRAQFTDEIQRIADEFLQKDPNSFEGHRLKGNLAFANVMEFYRNGNQARATQEMQNSIAEFRKAAAIKPNDLELQIALARAFATDRQFGEAEKLYLSVIAQNKNLASAYAELYNVYLAQNRLVDAENILKSAADNNPKQYQFLTVLAGHYLGQGRRDDMIKTLDRLKATSKEYEQAYMVVGDFYLRVGDANEAIRQYQEGIRIHPNRKSDYQKRIIEAYLRQGKKTEAAQLNDAILKDNSKDTDAKSLQGSLLLEKGDVQKALVELQYVVTNAPDNFVARYNLGRAHLIRREFELARQQLTEAVRLRPNFVPARLALARLQLGRAEYDPAIKSTTEILAFDKQNEGAKLIQASALMGLQRFPESKTLLQSILQSNPGSTDALFQLGALYLNERKYKEAEDTFRKCYMVDSANLRGLMGVVQTYAAQNRVDQGMQVLRAESEKNPGRPEFRLALGNTAFQAGRYDLALAEYHAVLEKVSPDKDPRGAADVYFRLGEAYRRKGETQAGIDAMNKAKTLVPDNISILNYLGSMLDATGKKEDARKTYEAALRIDPNDPMALNNLAFLIAETGGDLDQALTYAQRAKQKLPQMFEVSDTLGWIYLKKNLSENAIEIFRDLVKKQPDHSTYRYHLGLALHQKGDNQNARKELQVALQSKPPKEEEGKIKELIAKIG